MNPAHKLRISTYIFTAACIYAFIAAVSGVKISEELFSFLTPAIHAILGRALFEPLSSMLTILMEHKLEFTFTVIGIVICLCVSLAIKHRISTAINQLFFRILRVYCAFIICLLTAHVFVTSIRVSNVFMYLSLLIIASRLIAARKSSQSATDTKHSGALFGWSFLFSVIIAIVAGVVYRMAAQLLTVVAMLTIYDAVALRKTKARTPFGSVNSPAGMAILLFGSSLGAIGNFWLSEPLCNERNIEAGGARIAVGSEFRPYDMLLKPQTERMYIVYKEGSVSEYDLGANALVSSVNTGNKGSTQRLIYNPAKDEIYSTIWRANDEAAVLVLKLKPMRIDRTIKINKCPAIWLELDPATDSLLVLCEAGDKLVWYDYNTWGVKAAVTFPRLTWPHAVKIDAGRRRVYVCSGSMSRFLYEIDADKKTILRRAAIGYVNLGMAIDPEARRLYISKPIGSDILVFDTAAMKMLGYINARPGVRDIDIDVGRKELFAGNYINGTYQILSIPDGKVLRETFVGKQVRGVYHDDESNRNFAATACGVMELKQ